MKKYSILIILLFAISSFLSAAPAAGNGGGSGTTPDVVAPVFPASYIGLEFVKPSYDFIQVVTDKGSNHISFGNPKNDGSQEPIVRRFYINYKLQSPGTLFVFFSSKNDLGYDGGAGDNSNPYMIAPQGGKGGLNYAISAVSQIDGPMDVINTQSASFKPTLINTPIESVQYLDLRKEEAGLIPTESKLKSGVVIRHFFPEKDIDDAIAYSEKEGIKYDGGFYLTGKETITLMMDVNKHDFKAIDEKGNIVPGKKGVIPSGLYYGYIVVHYSAL